VDGQGSHSTHYTTTEFVDDATTWIQAHHDHPWFVCMAFNAPHTPFHKPPTSLLSGRYAGLSGTPADISANPRPYWEASMQAMDTEIARLLKTVDRGGTDIIYIGDNGTATQVIQPPYDKKRAKETLYEGGIHVPLIIAGPDVVNPGRASTATVNSVDLFATILEMAGINVDAAVPKTVDLDSVSLMPILKNTADFQRYAYSEQFGGTLKTSVAGRAIRNERYKLIAFDNGRQEFYDLQTDPVETRDLLAGKLTAEWQTNYTGLASQLGIAVSYSSAMANHGSAAHAGSTGYTASSGNNTTSVQGNSGSPKDVGGDSTSSHGGHSNVSFINPPAFTASYADYLLNKTAYDASLVSNNQSAPNYSFEFTYEELLGTDQRGVPLYLDLTDLLDSDGDGIPDVMEDFFGFNKADPTDAPSDAEGTGYTNLNRYLAGQDLQDSTQLYLCWAHDSIPNVWKIRHEFDLFEPDDVWLGPDKDFSSNLFQQMLGPATKGSNAIWDYLSDSADGETLLENLGKLDGF
jgi:Sulfatase